MPSEKRARQRAARNQKQTQIAKVRKRRTTLRRVVAAVVVAAIVVAIVFLINGSSKPAANKGSTTTSTSSTTSTSTTVASGPTFPAPSTQPLNTTAVAATCPPVTAAGASKRVVLFSGAPPSCIAASSVFDAVFTTSVGSFTVQMNAASSFAAVNNFVFLARWHYFDGTKFHRVIPGFVVQGGDPAGTGTGAAGGAGGSHGYPGYSFTGNTPPASCKTNPNQAACYQPGDLAMANSSGPSTDGSQFFVVLPGGQKVLNGEPNYTLFGKVIKGMSVADKIGADGSSGGTPAIVVYLTKVTVTQVSG